MLGFGLNLDTEADTGEVILSDQVYHYFLEHGVVKSNANLDASVPRISGACLLALTGNRFQEISENPVYLAELKQLMRFVINFHLGNKKLKSREMFKPIANKSHI